MTTTPAEPRTYGGWRRQSSPGIGSLTLLPTIGLFAAVLLATVAVLLGGLVDGLVVAAVCLVLLAPLVVRVADRPAWREIALQWVWWRARSRGVTLYRSGPLAGAGGTFRLPGLLARSRMWRAQDAYGRVFGLVEHPATRQWTVVLGVNPHAGALISAEERDVRVAQWDRWLAGLSREPGVDQVAVVLDQIPDPGRVLQVAVETGLDPDAPPFALAVMRDAARHLPTGGAEITAHVAVTFGARGLRVAGPEVLAARVRGWYDPAVQVPLAEAEAQGEEAGITWDDAGPVAAQELWASYRHDSGLSRTYEMVQPPRGAVFDSVLLPLTAAMGGVRRKRVTLLFRPLDAAAAPAALDRQVRAAINRAGRRRGLVHAHDSAEVRSALQAAHEEATGAGVTNVALLVTVTEDGEARLRQAGETVTRAARQAQIRLRPVYGAQAAAFAAALGVGIVPADHSIVPPSVRDNL